MTSKQQSAKFHKLSDEAKTKAMSDVKRIMEKSKQGNNGEISYAYVAGALEVRLASAYYNLACAEARIKELTPCDSCDV